MDKGRQRQTHQSQRTYDDTVNEIERFWQDNDPEDIHEYIRKNIEDIENGDLQKGFYMAIRANHQEIKNTHQRLDTLIKYARWSLPLAVSAGSILVSVALVL